MTTTTYGLCDCGTEAIALRGGFMCEPCYHAWCVVEDSEIFDAD